MTTTDERPATTTDPYEQGRADATALRFDYPAEAGVTTTQALVDQLIEEGHDGGAAIDVIERIVELGGFEFPAKAEDDVQLLTSGEVRVIRNRVTGEPLLEPTSLPCPAWCTEPAGHGFETVESKDGVYLTREHVRWFGSAADVRITCQETAESNDGPVDFTSEPLVTVEDPGALDVGDVLEVMQDLLAAGRFLLGINTAQAGQ